MFGLDKEELRVLKKLNSPRKIQDFLESLPYSFDKGSDMLRSPRRVLRERTAHCIEGAFLAAAALWVNGNKPLLLDLRSTKNDLDHVVALFRSGNYWGAISKTNHVVLRYREPIFRNIRELALSYFHEYFLDDGRKTMRDFSRPYDISRHFDDSWLTREDDMWDIATALDDSPHELLIRPEHIRTLRPADPIEIEAGKLVVFRES